MSLEIERHELEPIVVVCISGMERQCLQKHGGEQVGGMMPLNRNHTTMELQAHLTPSCNDSEARGYAEDEENRR